MNRVFLLLGSNLDNRDMNLRSARGLLDDVAGTIIAASAVYRTAAWGITDQPYFYNQAIELKTSLSPEALLSACLEIERAMGRKRMAKWGERLIDIDVLFYGDLVLTSETLQIPHPQIPFRRFTLQPLSEIAADLQHPVLHRSVLQLLEDCPDPLKVTRIKDQPSEA